MGTNQGKIIISVQFRQIQNYIQYNDINRKNGLKGINMHQNCFISMSSERKLTQSKKHDLKKEGKFSHGNEESDCSTSSLKSDKKLRNDCDWKLGCYMIT